MSPTSPIFLTPKIVPKNWGGETILCNNEEFCGKLLTFRAGGKFSMHSHRDKREVWWFLEGEMILHYINPADATWHSTYLAQGDVIEIPRMLPHQLEAREDCRVVEFSTHHEESDSYRVSPGDSQK